MTHRLAPHRPASRPRGFTLVELLVVITIISVLMALITVASLRFVASARESATRTTIKKVSEAINDRVGAVNRFHQRPVSRLRNDWQFRGWDRQWRIAGLDNFARTSDAESAMLVLSRKGMLRELLPVDQAELKKAYWFWAKFQDDDLTTPNFVLVAGVQVPYLNSAEQAAMDAWLADMDGDPSNGMQSLDRPGEVFLYALLNAPVFGGERMAEEDFKPSELVDPVDGDGVLELGDAWGNELRFYRWPTRLVNNHDSATAPLSITWGSGAPRETLFFDAPSGELDLMVDPDDRAGYLATTAPLYDAEKDELFILPPVEFFHDPNTWHTPLLVSAGPDGILGIAEPNIAEPVPPVSGFEPRTGLAVPLTAAAEVEGRFDNLTNHNASGGF